MTASHSRSGLGRSARARHLRHDDAAVGLAGEPAAPTEAAPLRLVPPIVTPVTTALPVDVERKLAELVGIEPVVSESVDEVERRVVDTW